MAAAAAALTVSAGGALEGGFCRPRVPVWARGGADVQGIEIGASSKQGSESLPWLQAAKGRPFPPKGRSGWEDIFRRVLNGLGYWGWILERKDG